MQSFPFPLSSPWLAMPVPDTGPHDRRSTPPLVAAVAAIVALAAERARRGGELGALREAIEGALAAAAGPQPDPRDEDAADLPCIADADPALEAVALRALMGRLAR
jgi:hypothetical protein